MRKFPFGIDRPLAIGYIEQKYVAKFISKPVIYMSYSERLNKKNTIGKGWNIRVKEHHLILTKMNIKHVNNWKTLVIIIWTCRTVFKLLWFYTVTSQTSKDPNSGSLELFHVFFKGWSHGTRIPDPTNCQWAKFGRLGFSGNKTLPSHRHCPSHWSVAQVSRPWNRYSIRPEENHGHGLLVGSWNPPDYHGLSIECGL